MSETNFPSPSAQPKAAGKNYKNAVIGVLSVALVAVSGYLIYAKNDSSKTIQQQTAQIEKVSDEKSNVQSSFDASLARLDSMSTVNTGLESQLKEKNTEIEKQKPRSAAF